MRTRLAVIGGSGLYAMEGVRIVEEIEIPTPFGLPSDLIAIAEISGEAVAFLPRHGKGHRYSPAEVPSAANIWALKSLGVEQIVSVSAVGSLVEEFKPGDFVLCDQLIDKTGKRTTSFFGSGLVGHVPFAEPFCVGMRTAIGSVLTHHRHPHHPSGTYVCMEGPLFSTKAESALHRSWNAHLIGMTAVPEAKLAREAEICYATIAMVTDYDCWKETGESVSVDMIMATMRGNTTAVKRLIPDMIGSLARRGDCPCRHAAADAMMTDPALIPYDLKRKLAVFYGGYWKK
jgi:5'-methylthioadenosine phosphorylase